MGQGSQVVLALSGFEGSVVGNMGCGASSAKVAAATSDTGKTLLEKPVLGVSSAEVVKGAPVLSQGFESIVAESNRKAQIVQGLADAATAFSAANLVAAAGLAMAAADVAETMAMTSGVDADPNQTLPSRDIAAVALVEAKAGSEAAASLVEKAISTAVAVAQARRTTAVAPVVAAVTAEGFPLKKNIKYSEIIADCFRGGGF